MSKDTFPLKTSEVLTRAANFLETHDLHKGTFVIKRDAHGKRTNLSTCNAHEADGCCMGGAVYAAVTGYDPKRRSKITGAMARAVQEAFNALDGHLQVLAANGDRRGGILSFPAYNDHSKTTKEEVVQFLRCTAMEAATREGQ